MESKVGNDLKIDDEIDLSILLETLKRYKKLISKTTFIGILLGIIYILFTEKTWQGEFQILLEDPVSTKSLSLSPRLARLSGIASGSSKLKTKVGILRSPLILQETFDYVKSEKKLKGRSTKDWLFDDWIKQSVSINLEKGTNILNISYEDNDKDLILPVLNKVSKEYQDYSRKKRIVSLDKGLDYYKDQISLYESNSNKSFLRAQKYAMDQNISNLSSISNVDLELKNSIQIEANRLKALDKIRVIEYQLNRLEDLKKDPGKILYVGSTVFDVKEIELIENTVINKLGVIDSQIQELRVNYKDSDPAILNLRRRKELLLDLLVSQVEGLLKGKKELAEANMISSTRPEGVIIEYTKLLDQAQKDKTTLNKLEDEYRFLSLEKARNQEPWELISQPQLLPYSVAPSKKRVLAFGAAAGFLIGCFTSLALDKRKNIIFSLKEIKQFINWPILSELSISHKKSFEESLDLLIAGPLSDSTGAISLLSVGEIPSSYSIKVKDYLEVTNRSILSTDQVTEATKNPNIIILIGLGVTKNQDIIDIDNKLVLQKNSILGLIAFND